MPTLFDSLTNIFGSLFSDPLDVQIDGVEISQTIQYYHSRLHLSDPAQQGADNSIRLVANKPALVRVYLRPGLRSFGPARAKVDVLRRSRFGVYQVVATLTPMPPGEMLPKSNPVYAIERGDQYSLEPPAIPGSLNFPVPGALMFGGMLFRVAVSESRGSLFGQGPTTTREIHVEVDLKQTLRLRSIMVGYSGPKSSSDPAPLFLPPPNYPADLLTTARVTLWMFPVESTADCSSAGWVTCDRPLDDAPGCSPNWNALTAKLIAQRTSDGNRSDVIYYGLLPLLIPFRSSPDGIGCERSGISVGRVSGNIGSSSSSGGVVMAHQVGHECGLLHAPGTSNFTDQDPNYPAYPPYDPIGVPKGSMGEYGVLLLSTPQITLPRAKDIMGSPGFSGDMGVSLYHHGHLIENPKLDPVYVGGITAADASSALSTHLRNPEPKPMISLIGLMASEREFTVASVMRLETRPVPSSTPAIDLRAELRDADGVTIARAALSLTIPRSEDARCGCHGEHSGAPHFPCVVQALLPDVGRGAQLAICNAERDLWVSAPGEKAPRIASFDAGVEDQELIARWKIETTHDVEVWLQWSADGGKTWNALATGLTGDHARFNASDLPSGRIVVRLLAGNGFDTTVSDLSSVLLPQRPPIVIVLSPQHDESFAPHSVLRLWGSAILDGRPAEPIEHATWLLDGSLVAEGLEAFIPAPRAGEHVVELAVTAAGREGRASHAFVVREPERPTRTDAMGGTAGENHRCWP